MKLALALVAAMALTATTPPAQKPIILSGSGGFVIGGKVMTDPANPEHHMSCDHGYVEYFTPAHPRRTSLVMWHSSSTQVWQNRWDGGEGYKDMFLRRDYPVYLWDGPRVGRANWACEKVTYDPFYRDEQNSPPGTWAPLTENGGRTRNFRRTIRRRGRKLPPPATTSSTR